MGWTVSRPRIRVKGKRDVRLLSESVGGWCLEEERAQLGRGGGCFRVLQLQLPSRIIECT